ncbi:conjugal transfer protein TraX [Patescibacteria group bacterium]|nr:conjugal transfer protein TraX [Patescibacteria group bacterium]MBU4082678.1 conjugal transfer protein TraX [Patescibacteria group bacterium]MCG2809814.1 conjugal transfer protein TraX [Candidatus Portnoybacteria bacterium]
MSSFSLKIIAVITMVADHVGFLFFPHILWLRIIGRISLPIFAFLIGEGYEKTSNVKKYFFRLAIFALISFVPHYFLFKVGSAPYSGGFNIFFTLTAGLLGLIALNRYSTFTGITALIGIATVAELLRFDYGAYGVLLICALRGFRRHKIRDIAFVVILIAISVSFKIPPGTNSLQYFSLFALLPIFFYNGAHGMRFPRMWFYWFYPAHILILIFLKIYM